MSENKPTKKSFPIAGIAFILYGIFILAMDLYYSTVYIILYDSPISCIITDIDFFELLWGLVFIGLGIMLIYIRGSYVPAVVTGGIISVFFIIRGVSYIVYCIMGILNNGEYWDGPKYMIADIVTIFNFPLFAIAFAVFTVYILLAANAKKNNKTSGLLSMWFVPAGVCFVSSVVFLITVLISDAIWQSDFLYITGDILDTLTYIVLAVAMLLYCMGVNKENKQSWVCSVCGYLHVGGNAPEVCPSCSQPQASFEIKAD